MIKKFGKIAIDLIVGSAVLLGASTALIGVQFVQHTDQLFAGPKTCYCEFRNDDESYLYSCNVIVGDDALYQADAPSKEETEEYRYRFSGWDLPLSSIKKETIFHAQYEEIKKEYTATFVNFDGSELFSERYGYGDTPIYLGMAPEKPANELYTYSFTGWDKEIGPLTEDTVYTALFKEDEILYTVTFVNDDDSFLDEDKVGYNGKATYHGPAPVKASDHNFSYTFKCWDAPLSGIISDTTIKALYDQMPIRYVVTFKNYDETVLYIDNVPYDGTAYNPKELPTRPSSADCVYTFAGWDKPLSPITEDTVIHATYSESTPEYIVTFKNYDGSVLSTSTVKYSETAIYQGDTPKKPADEHYTYTFSHWDRSLENVTYDYFTIAIFDSALKVFTVAFANYDKTELQKVMVEYGKSATYSGPTPARPDDDFYTYTFKEWNENLSSIKENLTTYALFDATPKVIKGGEKEGNQGSGPDTGGGGGSNNDILTVQFNNWDGEFLDADDVPKGGTAYCDETIPPRLADKHYQTYTFCSFDKTLTNVQTKFATYAQYTVDDFLVPHYIVTFRNSDGTLLCEDVVEDSAMPSYLPATAPKDPFNKDSVFVGWDRSLVPATKSYTLYAIFKAAVQGSSGGGEAGGDVSSEVSAPDETPLFDFSTSYQGPIYFRDKSYVDYGANKWSEASAYSSAVANATNPLYFTGEKLKDTSATAYDLNLIYKKQRIYPLIPDYSETFLPVTLSDAYADPDLSPEHDYTFAPFALDANNGAALKSAAFTEASTTATEMNYADYVKKTYLHVPADEKEFLTGLIQGNNLKIETDQDILSVVEFVRSYAKYNSKFTAYPSGVDNVLYFLKTAKEGICNHFASVLTLLFRTLGLPARFVTGFLSAGKGPGETVTVNGKSCHAWCEAYFAGIGWLHFDATPGEDQGGDPTPTPGGDKPTPGPTDDDPFGPEQPLDKAEIVFVGTPDADQKIYDGKIMTFVGSYQGSLKEGETVTYHFQPGDKKVGYYLPDFTARIYDNDGNDVSKNYYGKVGWLRKPYIITPREISLTTASATKDRDGAELTAESYTLDGELAEGDVLSLDYNGSQTNPGTSSNFASCTIVDAEGSPMTDNYAIRWIYGSLSVK